MSAVYLTQKQVDTIDDYIDNADCNNIGSTLYSEMSIFFNLYCYVASKDLRRTPENIIALEESALRLSAIAILISELAQGNKTHHFDIPKAQMPLADPLTLTTHPEETGLGLAPCG